MRFYTVSVGYEGPTDTCLCLTNIQTKQTKEYLIESIPWKILSLIYQRIGESNTCDKELGDYIWNNKVFDEDCRQ